MNKYSKLKKYFYIFIITIVILLFFKSVLSYEFYIIDDHRVISLLGVDNYFSFVELKEHLINKYSLLINFKTGLSLIKYWWAIETYFFQNNVTYFYLVRLSIIIIFFIVLFIYSSKLIGINFALILSLIFISSNSISDIVTRISTAEFITIFSLIFLIPLFYKIFYALIYKNSEHKFSYTFLILYFFFLNIFIFSKASSAIFIILPLFFVYFFFKKKLKCKLFLFVNFISLFLFLIYSYSILKSTNLDYHISSDIKKNLILISNFLKFIFKNYLIHLFLIIYIYFKDRNTFDISKIYLIIFFFSFPIIFYQFIVYSGNLPSNTRYDFINDLIFYLTSSLLVYNLKNSKNDYLKLLKIYFVCLVLVLFSKYENFIRHHDRSNGKINDTVYFSSVLDEIQNLAQATPDNELVLVSKYVWDYELISSFFKYIKFRNIENKIYLKVNISEKDLKNKIENMFFNRLLDASYQRENLNKWSINPKLDWGFEDWKRFSGSKNCIELRIYTTVTHWKSDKTDNICDKSVLYIFSGYNEKNN